MIKSLFSVISFEYVTVWMCNIRKFASWCLISSLEASGDVYMFLWKLTVNVFEN